MLDIFVRINSIDPLFLREVNQPTPEMEGRYVRVTNLDTVPEQSGAPGYQLFHGILVDTNGEDVEEEEGMIVLADHEIDSNDNLPTLYGRKERHA